MTSRMPHKQPAELKHGPADGLCRPVRGGRRGVGSLIEALAAFPQDQKEEQSPKKRSYRCPPRGKPIQRQRAVTSEFENRAGNKNNVSHHREGWSQQFLPDFRCYPRHGMRSEFGAKPKDPGNQGGLESDAGHHRQNALGSHQPSKRQIDNRKKANQA